MRTLDDNNQEVTNPNLSIGSIIETDWMNENGEIERIQRYHVYTDYELQRMAEEEEHQRAHPSSDTRINALETGVDDSYDAIADLGVEVADHSMTLDDIMNAIAELGVELENLNG